MLEEKIKNFIETKELDIKNEEHQQKIIKFITKTYNSLNNTNIQPNNLQIIIINRSA